jgi:hypothetical protein
VPLGDTGGTLRINCARRSCVRSIFDILPAEDANAASITGLWHVPLAAQSLRYHAARALWKERDAALTVTRLAATIFFAAREAAIDATAAQPWLAACPQLAKADAAA